MADRAEKGFWKKGKPVENKQNCLICVSGIYKPEDERSFVGPMLCNRAVFLADYDVNEGWIVEFMPDWQYMVVHCWASFEAPPEDLK